MGRRKSSARSKSFTPSPSGAPLKKTKTTTLDQFWSQDMPPASNQTKTSKIDRRSDNTQHINSKFASSNPFAPLSDTEALDQHKSTLQSASRSENTIRQQRKSPRTKTTISTRIQSPGTPPQLPVPGKSLRLSESFTSISKSPQPVGHDNPALLSPLPSSTASPLASTPPVDSDNLEFVEETPSPLSPTQQQYLATAARRLLFIEDDSASESTEEGLILKPVPTNPNISVTANGPTMGEAATPPRGNLKDDRNYDTPPSPTSNVRQKDLEKSKSITQITTGTEASKSAKGPVVKHSDQQASIQTTASLKPPPQAAATTIAPSSRQHRPNDQPRTSPKPKPSRPMDYRFDLKLFAPPSTAPDVALSTVIKTFFAKLKTIDPTIVIYPWYNEHIPTTPALLEPNTTPTTITNLRKYFPRLFPRTSGGDYFTTIRLGFSEPLDHIVDNLSWWLKEKKIGLWSRPLQCEDTIVIGWLLYSTRQMDIQSLTEAIYNSSGIVFGL